MTFVFSSLLTLSLHINQESNRFLEQSYSKSNQPTVLVAFMDQKYKSDFLKKMTNDSNVDSAYVQDYYTGTFLNHGKSQGVIFFSNSDNKDFKNSRIPKLINNEIMFSESMKNTYSLYTGQSIVLKPGSKKETFKIKGFFKDPIFSSSISGQTRVLVSSSQFKKFSAQYPNNEMAKYKLLSAYTRTGVKDPREITQTVNKLGVLPSNSIDYSFTSIKASLNLIPSVFIILLVALSFFIFIAILIVLWYSITVTINDSKVDFAVLLSQGFTKRHIMNNYMVKPITLLLVGGVLGVFGEYFAYDFVISYLSNLTGIGWTDQGNIALPIIVNLLTVLVLSLICLLRWISMFRVDPTDAVKQIQDDSNVHSKVNIPINNISPKSLNFVMGINKFFSKFKQSSTLFLVMTILTFLLVITFGLSNLFSSNSGALKVLGADDGDIILLAKGDKGTMEHRLNSMINHIEKENTITYSSLSDQTSLQADHTTTAATILNKFNRNNKLLSGNYSKSTRQVLISSGLSKKINKIKGQSILLNYAGKEKKYKISGTYNSLNNNGLSLKISTSSLRELSPSYVPGQAILNLKSYNSKIISNIISHFDNKSNINIQNGRSSYITGVSYVRIILYALVGFIMIVTISLNILLLIMLVKLTVIQEKKDIQTLEMIGYSHKRINHILLYRFVSVVLLGQVLGITLAKLLGNKVISTIFNKIGLIGVSLNIPIGSIIISCLLVIICSIASVLLVNGKRR